MKNHQMHTSQRQYNGERQRWLIYPPHTDKQTSARLPLPCIISAWYKPMLKWLLSTSTDYDRICPYILLTCFWLQRFHFVSLLVSNIASKSFLPLNNVRNLYMKRQYKHVKYSFEKFPKWFLIIPEILSENHAHRFGLFWASSIKLELMNHAPAFFFGNMIILWQKNWIIFKTMDFNRWIFNSVMFFLVLRNA